MADSIHIKLPDGSVKELPKGGTALDVARSIGQRLADDALVAKTNGDLIDLTRPLEKDTDLRILTDRNPEALDVYRHSSAHLLAAAVLELFPETKLGHGPATESGFFYDFYRPTAFTPEDLEKIEKKMQELVQQNIPYAREFLPRDQGLAEFKKEGDFMKCHFIEQFTKPDEMISIYRTGRFTDFCRGPHIPATGKIKAFKLFNVAGAYWLGDEKNQQLQRIYGTSFFSKKDLDAYLRQLEEAKKRDHRVLGKQLDLFSIQELAGPGLIFWHPKGGIIRKEMEDWMRAEYIKRGYSLVYTPHVVRRQLFNVSGHEGYYSQNMFDSMELDDAEYRLKPMNCPGHILIYKNSPKSYRDLPVRYAELGNVYRYERSGTMHGLLRVRGFTQDDAHIFCTPGQIVSEIEDCLDFAEAVLKTFGFDEYRVELSMHDPNKAGDYVGKASDWDNAEAALKGVLTNRGVAFKSIPGEGAFYGPKIDIKLVDVLGRLWQLSTVQFDFNLPARFELEYKGEDGELHQPVMVHRALFGSVERFFGVLIEHYAGAFPMWLAPVQVGLVPISEKHVEYAAIVKAKLEAAGLRVELDARNEKMNAKIREFTLQKVPFVLVMGDKEAASEAVSVRTRGKGDEGSVSLAEFIVRAKGLVEQKSPGL